MPKFIRPDGGATNSVAICDRCRMKRPYDMLGADPNYPGLRVCWDRDCHDRIDPYRLPPHQSEQIALRHPRPEQSLSTTEADVTAYNELVEGG